MIDFDHDCSMFTKHMMQTYNMVSSNTLQYASSKDMKSLWDLSDKIVLSLDPTKTYLNIGTGAGVLERIARDNNRDVKTVEQHRDEENTLAAAYNWWNKRLGIEINYRMQGLINDEFEFIGMNDDQFDEAIATRFGPFQSNEYVNNLSGLLEVLSRHTPRLRVYEWECNEAVLDFFYHNYDTQHLDTKKRVLRVNLSQNQQVTTPVKSSGYNYF